MFRLADRIVVLRQGRVVGRGRPAAVPTPTRSIALLSGQQVDSSARRQLTRLHGLADRLASADPSSSLSLILSALGAALGARAGCASTSSTAGALRVRRRARLPAAPDLAPGRGCRSATPAGRPAAAARREERVIDADLRVESPAGPASASSRTARRSRSSWSVPVTGPAGVSARDHRVPRAPGAPQRDELDLVTLYAGYAASAVERERLLDEVTARNRVLETIREMLETLAGPGHRRRGSRRSRCSSLRRGLQADEVALLTARRRGEAVRRARAYAGPTGSRSRRRCSDLAGRRRAAERCSTSAPRRPARAHRHDGRRPASWPCRSCARPARRRCSRAGAQPTCDRAGDRADRGRGPLAAAGARARGGRAGPPGGRGAAPLAASCSASSCRGSATSCARR